MEVGLDSIALLLDHSKALTIYVGDKGSEFFMYFLDPQDLPQVKVDISPNNWITVIHLHVEEEADTAASDCNSDPNYDYNGKVCNSCVKQLAFELQAV